MAFKTVPDNFFELIETISSDLKSINESLNDVLNVLVSNYWIEEVTIPPFDQVNQELNRNFYVWQNKSLYKLENDVNKVIEIFNDQKMAPAPDYIKMKPIALDKPEKLVLDQDFRKKWNDILNLSSEQIEIFNDILTDYGLEVI
ncbi:hypothetical protein [Limosilactobacillus reuteri]|uniref:hypothetical protein n=1 Tax=Limosilactobacillus reuteri TaxID=1598 RepID=UPI002F264B9E